MDSRHCHARRRVAGRIGALIAAVLVIPGLTLAPAHAVLSKAALPLDPIVTPILDPVVTAVTPGITGAGAITSSVSGLVCSNVTATSPTSQITCSGSSGLSPTELLAAPGGLLELTAAPAPGWEFDGWSGTGCTGTDPSCTINLLSGSLSTLIPIAEFIPSDGTGGGGSEPLPGTCEIGIADCTPPVTKLTSKPTVIKTSRTNEGEGVTRATEAAFAFSAFEPVEDSNPPAASSTPTPEATFECSLGASTATPVFTACPGTAGKASYTGLKDGTHLFAVRAVDADGNKDATPETFTWTVDNTAPETELNVRPKFWVLTRKLAFALDVAAPDVAPDMKFQCYLDTAGRACDLPVKFAAGTHTFEAAAIDKVGNQDTTPVAATFTAPLNNTELAHSKGWTKAKVKGTFLKTASITKKKGAKVATKATGITRIALVASKGKGFGTVKVMLGKKTLKKVSLAHKRGVKKKVIAIARFATPVNGKVTVQVVSQGKKVVVEGLGIATG